MGGGPLLLLDSDEEEQQAPKRPRRQPPSADSAAGASAAATAPPAADGAPAVGGQAECIDLDDADDADGPPPTADGALAAQASAAAADRRAARQAKAASGKRPRPTSPVFIDLDGEAQAPPVAARAAPPAPADAAAERRRRRRAAAAAAVAAPEAAAAAPGDVAPAPGAEAPSGDCGGEEARARAALERRAEELTSQALWKLPEDKKATKFAKVKNCILKRLLEEAVAEAAAPPPPEEEQREPPPEKEFEIPLLATGEGEAARRPDGDPQPSLALLERQAIREKRRALWQNARPEAPAAECDSAGPLSANGWEHSRFHSAEERGKFLRLMGGKRFAEAAEAVTESLIHDRELPTDCPTFELGGNGEWLQTLDEENAGSGSDGTDDDERHALLERQFLQGMQHMVSRRRKGLGA